MQPTPSQILPDEPFPWHIGVYDAHCHPTESMATIPQFPAMKVRVLTIMASRSQDQHLVAQLAAQHSYHPSSSKHTDTPVTAGTGTTTTKVIPSFGYHPWFSHLIYDDLDPTSGASQPDKATHYNSILTPSPIPEDLLSSLPNPIPLSTIIQQTRDYLLAHPRALLGEVGIDRAFRIPHSAVSTACNHEGMTDKTAGTHHSHALTKQKVIPAHQIKILHAQLRLAGSLGRVASVHIVGGQGVAYEALCELWRGYEIESQSARARRRKKCWVERGEDVEMEDGKEEEEGGNGSSKTFPPRICLHSFSGPPDSVGQYLRPSIPIDFYFSFSEAINFSLPSHQLRNQAAMGSGKAEMEPSWARAIAAMKIVPDDRILVESDLHTCGEKMDGLLEDIVRRVCDVKGWGLVDGVKRLKRNWERFVFGDELWHISLSASF